jgi:hypothetical protein
VTYIVELFRKDSLYATIKTKEVDLVNQYVSTWIKGATKANEEIKITLTTDENPMAANTIATIDRRIYEKIN